MSRMSTVGVRTLTATTEDFKDEMNAIRKLEARRFRELPKLWQNNGEVKMPDEEIKVEVDYLALAFPGLQDALKALVELCIDGQE